MKEREAETFFKREREMGFWFADAAATPEDRIQIEIVKRLVDGFKRIVSAFVGSDG